MMARKRKRKGRKRRGTKRAKSTSVKLRRIEKKLAKIKRLTK